MGLGQVYLGLLEPRAYEMQARNSFPRLNTAMLLVYFMYLAIKFITLTCLAV